MIHTPHQPGSNHGIHVARMTATCGTVAARDALVLLTMLACAAFTAGCAKADTTGAERPVTSQKYSGYLPKGALPDSIALLAPPPAPGSAAMALDEEIAKNSLALRNSARWILAILDADVKFPGAAGTFSCALDAPISEADTPHLYALLHRSVLDAGKATAAAKNLYKRPRPFLMNNEPICTPDERDAYARNGAYPSGHATVGWTWALILAELAPEKSEAVLARGLAFGQSRVVCNLHWQSDVNQALIMGAATVARLHAEPAFVADMNAARAEIAVVRAKKLPPVRDCAVEAEALKP